jgi:hypothetical protein
MIPSSISRLITDSLAHNTLDSNTVRIYFQKSPAKPNSDQRGIEKLDWQVTDGANVIAKGTTAADGLIEVEVRGDSATLQLLSQGAPLATYDVSIRTDPLEANTTVEGVQRRLRALGYQIGDAGNDKNGVDGKLGTRTDRAIHDFQADHKLVIDGNVGSKTQGALDGEI